MIISKSFSMAVELSTEKDRLMNLDSMGSLEVNIATNPKICSFSAIKTVMLHVISGIGVASFWRGAWTCLDHISFFGDVTDQDQLWYASLISLGLTVVLAIITCILWVIVPRPFWDELYPIHNLGVYNNNYYTNSTIFKITRRIFHYILFGIFGFASVGFWRGVWLFNNWIVFPDDIEISFTVSICGGLLLLIISSRCSSIIAPPMIVPTDSDSLTSLRRTASLGKIR